MTLQPLNSNLPHSEPSELTVISTEDDDLLNNFLSSPTPKRLIKGITISHAGDKVVSEYQIGGFLGKGAFAKCYKVMEVASGKVYAGKVIEKSRLTKPHAKQKLCNEIKIHRSLKHPHIVGFHAFFQDSQNFYILLEMCNQKTLKDLLKVRKTLTEVEVRYFLVQCLDAIQYLHSQNIIHRDLKLENILIHNMKVKIGDFGLAVQLKDPTEKRRALCGTPNYIAPEVLDTEQGHSFEVDIWACGVILYSLLVGRPPFETNSVEETYQRIRTNTYSFPDKKPISDEAKNLIRRLLHPNPQCRPKIPEILADPFFHGKYIPRALSSRYLTEQPQQTENLTPKKTPLQHKKRKLSDVAQPQNQGIECEVPLSKFAKLELQERVNDPVVVTNSSPTSSSSFTLQQLRLMCNQIMKFLSHNGSSQDNKENQRPSNEEQFSHNQQQQHENQKDNSPNFGNNINSELHESSYQYWISKWVDLSQKFGLGYQFCDGTVGVCFNDGSRIVAHPKNGRMEFYGKPNDGEKQVLDRNASFTNQPRLKKRITLWNFFKDHLSGCGESQGLELLVKDSTDDRENKQQTQQLSNDNSKEDLIFVRHWQRRKHAIVFQLSNNSFQINFVDHTKVIVTPNAQYIIYVNKKGKRTTFCTSQDLQVSENVNEMLTRVRYAKDCIVHAIQMLNK